MQPTQFAASIRFDAVELKYPAGCALKNITLDIPAGATVAIVGHTGSGKSTLVSLIPRLIDPTRGAVFLDGIDLRDFDPEWLRRQIGFVPQETFLFSATLAENIAWGVDDATEEDIARAAELAGLAPDIASFPGRLSHHHRRARHHAFRRPEAARRHRARRSARSANPDSGRCPRQRRHPHRRAHSPALADVMRGRTTILISHRVSTVQNASQIFVIEHGEVAEQGTHAELIRSGGYYADLYQKPVAGRRTGNHLDPCAHFFLWRTHSCVPRSHSCERFLLDRYGIGRRRDPAFDVQWSRHHHELIAPITRAIFSQRRKHEQLTQWQPQQRQRPVMQNTFVAKVGGNASTAGQSVPMPPRDCSISTPPSPEWLRCRAIAFCPSAPPRSSPQDSVSHRTP